jgi:hypothetical protein
VSLRSPDFFIFGCERSGTTLLCALLSEHPEICVVNDSFIYNVLNNQGWPRNVQLAYKALSRVARSPSLLSKAESSHLPSADRPISADLSSRYLAALIARYRRRTEGNWLGQYAERLEQDPVDKGGIRTYRELLDTVLTNLMPDDQRAKPLLGEKTPIHSHMQLWLRDSYPEARTVVLLRHPVTNVAAMYKRRQSLGLERAIDVYLSYYQGALAELLDKADPGVTMVRYEDLVASPKEAVGSLQRWLGAGDRPVAETFHYFVKQDYVGDRIEPSRDDELRALLDDRQQRQVLARCAPIVQQHYAS